MSNITQVKAVVKESLLGQEQIGDLNLSAQSKATFERNCRTDEQSGEAFMTEEEFVDAIAPVGEDYVSVPPLYFQQARRWYMAHLLTNLDGFSTRSSVNNTPFSFASPIDRITVALPSTTGAFSKTCSRNQMPNMRLHFDSLMWRVRERSNMRTSRSCIT